MTTKNKNEKDTMAKIYFARHTHDWPINDSISSAIDYFYMNHIIAIHFTGIESWDSDDYSGQGKSAITYMNRCNESKKEAYIFASYKILGKQKVLLGKPRINSKCFLREHLQIATESPLKLLFLDNVQEVTFKDFPFVYLLPPKQSTFVEWKQCTKIANNYIQGKEFDLSDPDSYLPSALEVLCEEYLRETGALSYKLVKTGGQLKDFDIIGIDRDDVIVGAQVKSKTSKKTIQKFAAVCDEFGLGNFYFFTQGTFTEPHNMKIISLETVLNSFVDRPVYLKKIMTSLF